LTETRRDLIEVIYYYYLSVTISEHGDRRPYI